MTTENLDRGPLTMDELAAEIACDIGEGAFVNLGIGQPTRIADHLPPELGVILHTENGMLGMGPAAHGDEIDADLTNAGKVPVTELPGASYFHHADSFAMMRGGHLDVCVLGAFQVSATGDLANWSTGEPGATGPPLHRMPEGDRERGERPRLGVQPDRERAIGGESPARV